MTTSRSTFIRPLTSGLLGITLLLPASFFMLTLLARIFFGSKALYYYIAPSFLQSPFHLFAWHKAQLIIDCLLLAIFFNAWTILRLRLKKEASGWKIGISYWPNWLNSAIALQGVLLLIVLTAYTLIQHIRY
jgi:hypothetical protein